MKKPSCVLQHDFFFLSQFFFIYSKLYFSQSGAAAGKSLALNPNPRQTFPPKSLPKENNEKLTWREIQVQFQKLCAEVVAKQNVNSEGEQNFPN